MVYAFGITGKGERVGVASAPVVFRYWQTNLEP